MSRIKLCKLVCGGKTSVQRAKNVNKKRYMTRVLRGSKSLYIAVTTLEGKSLRLRVKTTDTIKKLKHMIAESEGVPAEQQSLLFAGQVLSDEVTLKEYSWRLALRGGGWFKQKMIWEVEYHLV